MRLTLKYNFFLFSLLLILNPSFAQDTPSSFLNNEILSKVDIVNIDNPLSSQSKKPDDVELFNYTFAVTIPNLNLLEKGKWIINDEGEWIWILRIKADGAKALALDFKNIDFDANDELYIFNNNKNIYNISNTNISYSKTYPSNFFDGDNISVEFNPGINDTLRNISEKITLNYAFKEVNGNYGFGTSGDCEINANCNDEENFQPEKRAVVRIRTVKTVNGKTWLGWCTGTIVGNTNQDDTPYMITADHCYNIMVNGEYEGASAQDLNDWKFYFNYESPSCDNPSEEGDLNNQVIEGATYKANAGTAGDADSDFCLLELNNKIPDSFNPFWAGWDNKNISSPYGYCYHHPLGDIKKVNVYNKPLISSQYDSRGPANTHWKVFWDIGVTEAGSSGSPLFNYKGQIVGTLTGGGSGCKTSTESDFYGKFSYSWSYKDDFNKQLKHWLDPSNKGYNEILGYDIQGEKKIIFNNEIKIYPNPITNGEISFGNIDPNYLEEITIYTLNGKTLLDIKYPMSKTIETNFPSGVYFLKTKYKGKISIDKLLFIN